MSVSKVQHEFQRKQKKLKKEVSKPQVTLSSSNSTANTQNSIPIVVQSSLETVARFSIGVTSYALQRGYAAAAEDPNYPFYAYVYLGGIIINAMKSTNPGVQKVPVWLHKIIHSLGPKIAQFREGLNSYTWNIDFDNIGMQWIVDLGPAGCNRNWNCGIVDPSTTINDNIPEIVTPASSYTEALGQAAWTSLLNFLTSLTSFEAELMGVAEPSSYDNIYSAFADAARQFGSASGTNGGYLKHNRLEVPIKVPNLAVFTKFQSTNRGDTRRATHAIKESGGDSLFLGGLGVSDFPQAVFKSNRPPVFKPIDFNKFLDTVATWVSKLQDLYSNDFQNQVIVSNNPQDAICPLTLQEVGLLLRNEFMNAFDKTQYMVQGVYPNNQGNANPFCPFVCGAGTYGVRTNGMLLPVLLVENIRALTARFDKGGNPNVSLPVIGIYCEDLLNWKEYSYTGPDFSGPYLSFQDPSSVFQLTMTSEELQKAKSVRSAKGETTLPTVKKTMAETPISFIDASASGSIWGINHQATLNNAVELWNTWLDKMKPFTDTLTTVAADGGLLAAPMVTLTSLVTTDETLLLNGGGHKKLKKIEYDRFKKAVKAGSSTLYDSRYQFALTSKDPILNHAFGIVQSVWISPEYLFFQSSDIENELTYQKMQSITGETNGVVLNDGGTAITFSKRIENYASNMVRTRNGSRNAILDVILNMEKEGRAGILSSIGNVLGSIIPGVKPIADILGSIGI